ncbi:xenobiotic reductase b [Paenibacillus polymyxa]|uniref:xenobiotic reductase b n=1 Tax=Paenibacillus polymyxa TaxID=1406 RepID=UPI000470218A|nr:xenobiotic reductase b [Paenibacillus polymyxa]
MLDQFLTDYTNRRTNEYGGSIENRIPVIANGQLDNPDKAATIIGQGFADVIALEKGVLANYDWIKKVRNGKPLSELDQNKVLRPDATIKDFEISQ